MNQETIYYFQERKEHYPIHKEDLIPKDLTLLETISKKYKVPFEELLKIYNHGFNFYYLTEKFED